MITAGQDSHMHIFDVRTWNKLFTVKRWKSKWISHILISSSFCLLFPPSIFIFYFILYFILLNLFLAPSRMELSQKNLLAIGSGSQIQFYQDPFTNMTLYMQHIVPQGYAREGRGGRESVERRARKEINRDERRAGDD